MQQEGMEVYLAPVPTLETAAPRSLEPVLDLGKPEVPLPLLDQGLVHGVDVVQELL